MSIFTIALIAHYVPTFIAWLGLLVLLYLALRLLDHSRAIAYRIGIDWLELKARYNSQEIDQQKQQLALVVPKQNLIDWANWYVAHQHDVELEKCNDTKN